MVLFKALALILSSGVLTHQCVYLERLTTRSLLCYHGHVITTNYWTTFLHSQKSNLPLSLKPLVFISAYYLVIAALVVILDINSKSIVWVFNYLIMLSIPFIYHAKESFKGQSKQNQINILFNCMILVLYATYLSYSRATWVGLTASLGLMFSITSIIDYQFNKRNLFIILGGSLLFTLLTYLFLIFLILLRFQPILK